ncbi:MAG: peptidoglycan binding domain-containing protein [Rubrobacteraceae bacterium]
MAVLVTLDAYANTGEVYRGVKVAGVSVGGETLQEARDLVGDRLSRETPEEIRLVGSGENAALGSEELGIDFQLESTVDRAYEVGRTGWIGHRISERFRASLGMVDVDANAEFDTDLVRNVVGDLASGTNQEPQNAVISLSGTEAQVQESQAGFKLDQAATVDNVRQAIGNLNGEAKIAGGPAEPKISTSDAEDASARIDQAIEEPLVLEAGDQSWNLAPEQVAQLLAVTEGDSGVNVGINAEQLRVLLPDMYKDLQTEPKDAGFEFVDDNVKVVPAQPGKQVAQDKLAKELNGGLFDGQHTFEVPLNDGRQPELTTEKAESLKPTERLGKFDTNYEMVDDPDGNRTYNLDIAADAIDQTLLAPGEVFSVNDKVSQLDYKEAKVFQEGLIQYAEGGGLCQVASTLYVAATRAGLEIVERHPHYAMLEYIKPGFDSTVWFGDAYGNGELDSQFKNTTDGYVLLREWVDEDGNMYAEVWGQPTDTEAELRSERVDYDNSTSTWVTYKKVKENGEVVKEDEVYTDTYRSVGDNENYDKNELFNPVWEP